MSLSRQAWLVVQATPLLVQFHHLQMSALICVVQNRKISLLNIQEYTVQKKKRDTNLDDVFQLYGALVITTL